MAINLCTKSGVTKKGRSEKEQQRTFCEMCAAAGAGSDEERVLGNVWDGQSRAQSVSSLGEKETWVMAAALTAKHGTTKLNIALTEPRLSSNSAVVTFNYNVTTLFEHLVHSFVHFCAVYYTFLHCS